jgi:hypothetical protein
VRQSDFDAAMRMYAEADQRSTATLIELVAAAVLLKLNPIDKAGDVVSVSISPGDISNMMTTHHFDVKYAGEEMTVFLTPLKL